LEAKEAREQGWFDIAQKVRSEAGVIEFIKKHSGTYSASNLTGKPYEYCIGGSRDDAKVQIQIRGLERGRAIAQPKTKAEKELASIAESIEGILKWTFVFSLVQTFKEKGQDIPIKDFDETLLDPKPEDYLARVCREISNEEEIFCLDQMITIKQMERALYPPNSSDTPEEGLSKMMWQNKGLELSPDERWVLSTEYTHLWPYREADFENSQEAKLVVLYPDVFSEYGLEKEEDVTEERLSGNDSKRWTDAMDGVEKIMSVLPLAKIMGGCVTPHLHSGVTTILCLLKNDIETIDYGEEEVSSSIFEDEERGQRLLNRLESLSTGNNTVNFVSPEWVRKTFCDGDQKG
jgi:hypothetical protein